jgi:NADH dehydrogenase
MLTFFKQLFVWWNQQTIGTRIQTIFFGKKIGKDSFGNKYYQSKNGKRWIIYNGEIDASKIPSEWYSWIHFMNNKIKINSDQKKYSWQKQHLPNQTGTKNAYYPDKENNYKISKKYKSWKE